MILRQQSILIEVFSNLRLNNLLDKYGKNSFIYMVKRDIFFKFFL